MKKILIFISILCVSFSCADEKEQPSMPELLVFQTPIPLIGIELLTPEEYKQKCIRQEFYFCDLNANMKMEVVKDICFDPPKIISVGECEEFLECDPTQHIIETVECLTADGFPGTQDKICNKGQIQYTDCISLCEEEICDGEDNDCDEHIDEGQLNACGECGFLPQETCDNVDNNCDGSTDEGLIQQCYTACGSGVEYCIAGSWVSCTAPPEQIEICDGFDNDCDGSIDEDLTCECTIEHVGVLFPCKESPLICGEGYKTCECTDPSCSTIITSDCVAPCVYFPDPDEICDPQIGQVAQKEECNNYDDNCNELIDEDLYAQCYSEDPTTLYVGICQPGITQCVEGTWGNYHPETNDFIPGFCDGEVVPQEDVCNGVDDDCDGVTDSGEELEPTDILFIVDWSGSMDTEIFSVMAALNKFAGNYSDEEVLQWGTILTPIESAGWGFYEYSQLYQNLAGFTDFLAGMAQLNIGSYQMGGAKEMLHDVLYLAIHNLVGGALPIPISLLEWDISKGAHESVPPLKDFKINWRTDSNKVIILFSDEVPQSYLMPQVTQSILLQAISATTNLKIYTFSTPWDKENGNVKPGWEPLATASGGKWYELTSDMLTMYNNLMEIIDENACK